MKSVWMISITHMFVEIYFLTQAALIPIFIREFNLSLLQSSLIVTIPGLAQLLMNLPSGFLTERLSTRQLLFASMFAEGASALLVSQTSEYWMLVLGVSVMRISSPLYHISGLTQISRLVERPRLNRSLGLHNALGSVGAASGLVSLSVFLSAASWRWIYVFWGPPILLWGLLVLSSSQLKHREIEPLAEGEVRVERTSVLSSTFLVFLAVIGLRVMGYVGAQTYMSTYMVELRGLADSAASLVLGFGTFMGVAGSLYGGYLGDKVGAKKALSLAIAGSVAAMLFLGLMTQFYALVAFYLVYAFFTSSVWSPINAVVADITPKERRGFSFSIYFLTEGLVFSLAPAVAAAMIGLTQIWFIFPFGIALQIASLVMLQLLAV